MEKIRVLDYLQTVKGLVQEQPTKEQKLEIFNQFRRTQEYQDILDQYRVIRGEERQQNHLMRLGNPGLQPEQKEHKEALSDPAIAALISGTSNRENKAITLLVMREGTMYTKYALYKEVRDSQGKPRGWDIDKNTPFSFCESSFEPISLVAKGVIDPFMNTFGYIKTAYGQEVATPLAALLLDFSLGHPDVSLFGLFGGIGSGSKESEKITVDGQTLDHKKRVADRFLEFYRIFRKWVLEDQKFREANPGLPNKTRRKFDLLNALRGNGEIPDLPNSFFEHLDMYGVINYDSVDQHKPFIAVKVIPNANFDVPYYRKDVTLSRLFLTVIEREAGKYLTLDEVTGLVLKENSEYTEKPEEWQKELRDRVSRIATHYKKQGCVEVEKFDGDNKSEIKFTSEQEKIILELMDLLDKFQRLDPEIIARGRTLATSFTPRQLAGLMKKAKDNSPEANDLPYEQTNGEILSILRESPNLEGRPLLTALRERTNTRIAYRSQWAILKRMSNDRLVVSTDKRPKTWSLLPIYSPETNVDIS